MYLGKVPIFPDIELPIDIKNTKIKLISPEQGEDNQKKNTSSFYINLFASTNSNNAEFIFVTFSNGFDHQFDCFINYNYDADDKIFVIENTRFENYRHQKIDKTM